MTTTVAEASGTDVLTLFVVSVNLHRSDAVRRGRPIPRGPAVGRVKAIR
jgi:hypothetical protein